MKQSTPTSPKIPEPKSILLIGPPGSTKTTLMLQFPDLLVIDCDTNLDGPENFLRKGNSRLGVKPILPTLSYSIENINYTDEGKEVPPKDRYDRLIATLKSIRENPAYSHFQTVGVDGLTMINELIKFKIYEGQKKDHMDARDWDPFKAMMWTLVVRMLKNLGRNTILTCHETIMTKTNKDNFMIEEVIGFRPTVQGGIADYFSGFFTDAWRLSSDLAPGDKVEIKMETMKTVKSPHLKNSLGLPPTIKNPTYELLKPYFQL